MWLSGLTQQRTRKYRLFVLPVPIWLNAFNRPVFDLGQIDDPVTKRRSHCVIYVNAEPCPMCYTAINWARIPIVVFSCTRFDSAVPGVEFSDLEIYQDLARPYTQRKNVTAMQSSCSNSLDAFNLWRRSGCILPYEGHKPSNKIIK